MGCFFFSFKQKTAYEIRISDWSSDVCSSDLRGDGGAARDPLGEGGSHNRSRNRRRAGRDGGPAADHASPGRRPVGSRLSDDPEIGRASCRERVCQYVDISVVAVSYKKKYTGQQVLEI